MSLMATHVAHIITLHAACGDLSESASDEFFFFFFVREIQVL